MIVRLIVLIALIAGTGCDVTADIPLEERDRLSYCERLCDVRESCGRQDYDLCKRQCLKTFPFGFAGLEGVFQRPAVFAYLSCIESASCADESSCEDPTFEQFDVMDLVNTCRGQFKTCPYETDDAVCVALGLALPSAHDQVDSCFSVSCPNLDMRADECVTQAIFTR